MIRRLWTRDEFMIVFNLYLKTPFGKILAPEKYFPNKRFLKYKKGFIEYHNKNAKM